MLRPLPSAAGRTAGQRAASSWAPKLAPGAAAAHAPGCRHALLHRGAQRSLVRAAAANPAFSYGQLQSSVLETRRSSGGEVMTMDGAVAKSGLLLAVAAATAAYTWAAIFSGQLGSAMAVMAAAKASGGVALAAALATMWKPHWSPYTGFIYALGKGAALASFSAVMELRYPGIAMTAVLVTFGTFASLLALYQARVIRVTDAFRDAVAAVTGGYFLSVLAILALGFVGVKLPMLFGGGPLALGLSLLSAGLAASNLLLDFRTIEAAASRRMPKWMEWYSGFSLLMTTVWMYTTVLQLLSMFGGSSRD